MPPRVRVAAPKKKGEGKTLQRNTNLFITINTNILPRTQDEAEAVGAELHKTVSDMFNVHIEKILKVHPDSPPLGDMDTVDVNFSIERGKKRRGGRIHAHALVKIVHHTKISMADTRLAIKEHVKQEMINTLPGEPLVWVQLMPNKSWDEIVQEYIEKDRTGP